MTMTMVDHIIRFLARMGYVARGLVYLVLGYLTWRAATDLEETADIHDALQTIFDQQYGQPLLLGLAVGMVSYSIWRAVQSIFDVDAHGWNLRGCSVRLALLISAALHVALAWACLEIALRIGSGEGTPVRSTVRRALDWPAGDWLIMGAGVAVIGVGIAHIYKGVTGGFRDWFEASDRMLRWIDPLSRFGLIARGLIFFPVGGFLIYAGLYVEPDAARGTRGALEWVQALFLGRFLLGVVGIGLFAFGLYSITESIVRRVGIAPSPESSEPTA